MTTPGNPNATPEARALLEFLYSQYGKVTLTGQHDQMYAMSEHSARLEALTGHRPLVWGCDWGFSDARHPIDDIALRPKVLSEIRRHHAAGRVIVFTYHQASPTIGEPCDFNPGVILNLTDAEWDDLLDPVGEIHKVWAEHVDRLAEAFKDLQAERIPIIFRPYHEMNGGWFWWGGDARRFKALWAMIYDRFTHQHGLKNLLWAWNPDKPWPGVEDFFPGHATVDLVGTDIYPREGEETYPQEWYDRMKAIAGDKPLALSENSIVPDPADFERRPWAWFMGWDQLTFKANTEEALRAAFNDPRYRSQPWR